MRAFVNIWNDRIKDIIVGLHNRNFWGTLTLKISFKDGGITGVKCSPEEDIKI